jgi:formylglycine-generating enzyme required for sulfatase activity
MGKTPSDPSDPDLNWTFDEVPQHLVRITRTFYIGQTEVTEQQWDLIMGAGADGGATPGETAVTSQLPMVDITWQEARDFCDALEERHNGSNPQVKVDLDVPSEAQWEYAVRNQRSPGNESVYWFTDTYPPGQALADRAWFLDNAGGVLHDVGTTARLDHGLGLRDVNGNCWEWCMDYWEEDYDQRSPTEDPVNVDDTGVRACRGGDILSDDVQVRVSSRWHGTPGDRYPTDDPTRYIGLRVSGRTVP